MTEKTKKTVLVVDDEEELAELLQYQLENAGYEVLTANSGLSAMELLEEKNVDVIVSDVRMPEGNGVELFDEVQKKNNAPLFFFMTGFADLTKEQALLKGAKDLFSKPFNMKSMLEVIDYHLAEAS